MVFFIGCKNEIKFDSAEWNKNGVDWQITEYREKMVSDLIKSDTLIGLDKISVIEVLGKPEIETEKGNEKEADDGDGNDEGEDEGERWRCE